ncbi:addiction module protein [Serpentinimonas barnesii]|uniref:addiction module protein n=1 Tax=Serpentinimonas barnesii TaxID=1458427 RepID=UPI0011EA6947|nr:addiction module protein [Serpentinimonas barnesii]
MTEPVLLAIVEVPHDERVRCAAQGCGHSVYRRVHLVRIDGSTKVFGSDCFARLFDSTPTGRAPPKYGSGTGRSLTPEERALLLENTERLIEQFEREHQAEIADAERRRALIESWQPSKTLASTLQGQHEQQPPPKDPPPIPAPTQNTEAEAQARRTLGKKFPGVNLDLPGFNGLFRMEVEKILRANAAVASRTIG